MSNFIGCKTDIEVCLFKTKTNISVKTGIAPSMHQELLENFIEFLKTLSLSEDTIQTILFYHYRDGTYDGSGGDPLDYTAFIEDHKERIQRASEELSQPDIVKAIVYRCVIKGRESSRQEIDYLYYGDTTKGAFFSKYDLLEYAHLTGDREFKGLHFGPFVYSRKVRYSKGNHAYCEYSQIIWPHIKTDLKFIYDIVHNNVKTD